MHLPLLPSLLLLAATGSSEGFRTSETRHRPSLSALQSSSPNPFETMQSIFSPKNGPPPSQVRAIPDVVVESDYKIAAGFGAVGAAIIALDDAGVVGSVFGGFLLLL